MWLFDFFRYLRLKAHVSLIRLLVRFSTGRITSSPDSILQIQSRDPHRNIKAHLYTSKPSGNNPTPILVNFHGSGFVFHHHGTDDFFCRKIANETPYSVLDIQYRLAPESPFPACHDDCEDVVAHVLANPSLYSSTQIAIGGFSAGANIACVASSVTFPKDTFTALLAFYPPTNLAVQGTKTAPDPDGNPIPASMEKLFDGAYMWNGPKDPADERVSPALGPVENYPRETLFITCARDTLCLETEYLAKRVEEEGQDGKRNVVLRRMSKCDHAWDKKVTPGSHGEAKRDESYQLAVDMLLRTIKQ